MREEDLEYAHKTLRAVGYYIDSKINTRLYSNIRHSCFFSFFILFYQEVY